MGLVPSRFSGLRLVAVGSVREQELRERLGERIRSLSGKRVRLLHRRLVLDAFRDDVADATASRFTS
jgi:hypothetical protein